MRSILLVVALSGATIAQQVPTPAGPERKAVTLLVGGYGSDGIVRVRFPGSPSGPDLRDVNGNPIPSPFDRPTAEPLTAVPSPTFLLTHPTLPVIYTTSELSGGMNLRALMTTGKVLSSRSSGGQSPVRLAIDETASRLAVANYDGSVALFELAPDGSIRSRLALHRTAPAASTHPHSVAFDEGQLVVADLGANSVLVFSLGRDWRALDLRQVLVLPAGTGPRQIVALSPTRRAVVGELNSTLTILDRAPGSGRLAVAATLAVSPPGALAEGLVDPSGRWLVVLSRGPDLCISFDVTGLLARRPSLDQADAAHCAPGARHAVFDDTGSQLFVASVRAQTVERIGFSSSNGRLTRGLGGVQIAGAAVVAIV